MKLTVQVLLIVLASLICANVMRADVGGKITGTVRDQTNGIISGATLTAVNTATRVKQTAETNEQGSYTFPVLPVGQYEIDVVADGFKPNRTQGLVTSVGSTLTVDITLQLDAENETVTVTENSAQVGVAPLTTSRTGSSTSGGGFGTVPVARRGRDPIADTTPGGTEQGENGPTQTWNFHIQNTDIVQGYPAFPARYSGPQSLPKGGEARETVSLDLMAGVRLWSGAEAHIDGLMWQGFGLNNVLGIEGFPSGEAYRIGTKVPNGAIARLFIRQTINLGGGQEDTPNDQLSLAGKEDVSRLTFTIGRFAATDIFDTNAYAGDPRTQFMNWGLVNNLAWDYPADVIGFDTGLAVELNQPKWTLRYGFFQVPSMQNSFTEDDQILTWPHNSSAHDGPFFRSWAMVTEFDRRYTINVHPGAIRFLAYLNRANMFSYSGAIAILKANGVGADVSAASAYRCKYGFGLNWEQEIAKNVGVFSRLGWNDGQEEAWMFTDVDYTASLGLSVKGQAWRRPSDSFGLAGLTNGITHVEQEFLEVGGLGILAGDGNLNYGWERILETYYDAAVWKNFHVAVDYQFIGNPAFNRDRGPVSVFGVRLHWQL